MNLLDCEKILVTGGAGFLGSHVVDALAARGVSRDKIVVPRKSTFDLTLQSNVKLLFDAHRPDLVIHCAAKAGGIGLNEMHPAALFYENMAMGLHVIEESRRRGVKKLVLIGTTCSYPKVTPVPFREEDLWNGYPEETNAPYGIAKRALLTMGQAYRQEYGMNIVTVLPTNLYGPRDNFDLQTSHVIPAAIRKLESYASGEESALMWGDGSPSRDFLFVEDAAECVVRVAEKYDGAEPLNLGSGEEVTIRDLVGQIAKLIGNGGVQITWETTRPNGQPRRRLSTERAEAVLGPLPKTPLEVGLARTLAWWIRTKVAGGFRY